MKKEIEERFIRQCANVAVLRSDYKKSTTQKHNRAMRKIAEIVEVMAANPKDAEISFSHLMDSEDMVVRKEAAIHALRKEICTEKAVSVLEKLALIDDPEYGLFVLDVNMALKQWREKHGLPSPWQPF